MNFCTPLVAKFSRSDAGVTIRARLALPSCFKRSNPANAVKAIDDVGKELYPKSRKVWAGSLLVPEPGIGWLTGTNYWGKSALTAAHMKSPKVRAVMDSLSKMAGTVQTEYRQEGKKVYKIHHSSSDFEGAKQPNPEVKYFTSKVEIKDFATKREIMRKMQGEKMMSHKKLAEFKADVKLRPHQSNAVDRISKKDGSLLLSHATGSGKTVTALAGFDFIAA